MRTSQLALLLLLSVVVAPLAISASKAADEKVSKPGEYKGYSDAVYSDSKMTSQYVEMRDGTKLAIDIIRPAQDGNVMDARAIAERIRKNRSVRSSARRTPFLVPHQFASRT